MPKDYPEILHGIYNILKGAIDAFEAWGVSGSVPRILDYIYEAKGIYWGSFTDDERQDFYTRFPMLDRIISGTRIRYQELPQYKKELEKLYRYYTSLLEERYSRGTSYDL